MRVTPTARDTCNTERCQFCNKCNNSVITGPIALKLGMEVVTYQAIHFHVPR